MPRNITSFCPPICALVRHLSAATSKRGGVAKRNVWGHLTLLLGHLNGFGNGLGREQNDLPEQGEERMPAVEYLGGSATPGCFIMVLNDPMERRDVLGIVRPGKTDHLRVDLLREDAMLIQHIGGAVCHPRSEVTSG